MTIDRATLSFLQGFPESVRREGEALQRSGCVKQIFGNHLFIQARVEDGGEVYKTNLRLSGDNWVGSCTSDARGRSSAVYATMLERIERGGNLPEVPNEVGRQSLAEILEERLKRRLESSEEQFVDKLEKRYRRYEMEGEILDHDLVRLNSRWPVESYEPLELWPERPADIVAFWNHIAYAFEKRNLSYPEFMRVITDTEAVRRELEQWERRREVEGWRERVAGITDDVPQRRVRRRELRLLVLPSEARLQWRDPEAPPESPDGGYQSFAGDAERVAFQEAFDSGELRMDGESELLWVRLRDRLQELGGGELRFENPENTRLLARLFDQEALRPRIVNLDEMPFRHIDAPLRWECTEPPADADEETPGESAPGYQLRLVTAEGEEIHHSPLALPGVATRYLIDDAIFPGPPAWGQSGTGEIEPRHEIPASVLTSEAGVRFLSAIGAELPPSIASMTHEVRLTVGLRMELSRRLTGAESEHLVVRAGASDPDGFRTEVLGRDGWETAESRPAPEGAVLHFDRRMLHPVPDLLAEMSLVFDTGIEAFKTRVTRAFPERFAEWVGSLPRAIDLELDSELQSLLRDPVRAKVRFEVREQDIDWFDLKVVLDVEGLDLSQKELKALVAARGGFVRMKEGGWLRLEIDLDERQREAVNRLGLDIFDLTGETHRMHTLQLADPAAKEVFDPEVWDRICGRASTLRLQVQPAPPEGLRVTLRNYQVEGFHFLSYLATNRFGGILADDMGLGKTVQSLAWLLWLREQEKSGECRPSIVVCPKSVLDVWASECAKFAPRLRVCIIRSKEDLDVDRVASEVDLLVLNYSQLRVNSEKLDAVNWMAAILDEGQQIKNPDSKAAKAARQVNASHRLILTGTPIENRLLDVWSLMAFAMPGVLGDRRYFRERFDRRKDAGAQQRLSARLRPFLLRRTKSQVALDLPPRTEEDVFCKLEGVQEELYKAELKRIQDVLLGFDSDESLRKGSFVILQGLMRLRQICCHPALIDAANHDAESAKMTALFYLLDQLREEGHKVLVFSQFVTMLDLIRDRLEEEDRPFAYLTGQTKNRGEVIEKFQMSKDPTVFLLSLKAGGSGLNLTAASYVVLYDPWWNPAVENQAIDRTHRIGQENKVIAYRLLMRDSVEEKIRVLQEQKRALVTEVLGQESFTRNLTRDDLRFLLERS